ncbi:unnamed protein product [Dicrocoelium dendriticum]|nr:unnamed protein product [Dicrocoelium dendriticum]
MFTSLLCVAFAVCATLALHSSAKYIERHKRDVASDIDISSIDGFPFEGLYAPDDVRDDEVPTSSVTPASPIGPEFWNRIFNQENSEQLTRIAVNPVVQNVTRDEVAMMSATEITQPPKKGDADETDKKKKRMKIRRRQKFTTMQPTPHTLPAEVKKPSQAQEPRFGSPSQMHPNTSGESKYKVTSLHT